MKIDGLPVENGKGILTLHINNRDAKLGKGNDPGGCAAARCAIREKLCDECLVHISVTFLKKGKVWYRYATPESLQREMIALDRDGKFIPGDHTLRPMSPGYVARHGSRQGSSTNDSNKRGAGKKRRHYTVTKGVREFHGSKA